MNNKSIDELDLLEKVSQGDERSFNELFQLTHRRVYIYLYCLLRDKQIAEDVLVETYLEVWKGAKKFKGYSRVLTWIIGIARNLGMNELKKRKKFEDIDNFQNISNENMFNEEAFSREGLIKKAIEQLSFKHREILDLVFFQEMSYQEISELLNIPLNTVKTRVFYAKELLKAILKTMGVEKDEL
jgi:RNA polymerase sigma-70 factor (ECF subfamily)